MLRNAFALLKPLFSFTENCLLLIPVEAQECPVAPFLPWLLWFLSCFWSFCFLSEDVNFSCSQSIFSAVAFYMKHLGVKTRAVDSKKSRGGFFRRQLVKVQQVFQELGAHHKCNMLNNMCFQFVWMMKSLISSSVSPAARSDFSDQERRIEQSQAQRSVSRHPQLDSRQQYVLR